MKRIMKLGVVLLIMALFVGMFTVSAEYSESTEVTASVFSLPDETIEGKMDVVVKGNTYTNLLGDGLNNPNEWTLDNGISLSQGKMTLTADGTNYINAKKNIKLKENTTYTVIADVSENTLTTSFVLVRDNITGAALAAIKSGQTGKIVKTFDSSTKINGIFWMFARNIELEGNYITLNNLMILEGDYSENSSVYINNTQSTKGIEIMSIGKNILNYDLDFPSKNNVTGYNTGGTGIWRDNGVEMYHDSPDLGTNGWRIWTRGIPVDIGKEYTLSFKYDYISPSYYSNKSLHWVLIWEAFGRDTSGVGSAGNRGNQLLQSSNINGTGTYSYTFTPTSSYISIQLDSYYSHGFIYDIQLEEGSTATEYEPYRESTAYIPNGIELHSLDGVKDEIDIGKGLLIKRIGQDSDGELYQLDQPETTQLTPQNLIAYPNGTIVVETEEDSTLPTIEYSVPIDTGGTVDNLVEQVTGIFDIVNNHSKRLDKLEKNTPSIAPIYINCIQDKEINVALTVANIRDVDQRTFAVTYSTDDFQLQDLCTSTETMEKSTITSTYPIDETDIVILENTIDDTVGTVKFRVNKYVSYGNSWSGVVNTMAFKANESGQKSITFEVE